MQLKFLKNQILGFVASFLLFSISAMGQNVTLQGIIKEKDGSTVPGVSIMVKGTSRGTTSNDQGAFTLSNIDAKSSLVFRAVGFQAQEIVVGNRSNVEIVLLADTKELSEIVVTALGIKKEARNIGYTTQEVKGSEMVKAREPNPVNSLTGKIAGLTVAPSAEMLGRPQLILRGNADLLFVVDGVPVNSDTWNISADDIESYSVLKGPNAAALYGFRGQNGAILVTTKKGSKDDRKFSVDFNSSTMIEPNYLALPVVQSEYGYGVNYQYAYGNKTYDEDGKFKRTNLWGPRFEGQNVPQYNSPVDPVTGIRSGTPWLSVGKDNFKKFMEMGVLSTNNVAISASGEKYDLRMSIANNYQKGMAPNTAINITNFNLNLGYNFNPKLRLEGSLNANFQNSPNIPEPSSGPEGYTYIFNVYGSTSWNIDDMRDYYKGPAGKPGVQQQYAEYGRENNPYFMAYEWLREHKKTDVYGYAKLSYKLNDYMNFAVRSQVTTWNQLRTEKLPYSMITYKQPDLRQGDYREDRRNLYESNNDVLLTFDRNFKEKFHVTALGGANLRLYNYNSSFASTDFLIVPGVYDFSNSKFPVKAYNFRSDMEVASAYYTVDFSYKNYFTLGTTGRVDKLSTLPEANRNIFYPSVALSTVVTDYINLPEFVSFMKLRTSYANVKGGLTNSTIGTAYRAITGNNLSSLIGYGAEITSSYDGPSYDNQNTYNISTSLYNNTPVANYSGTIANPELQPFSVTSYEAGLDMKFLKNRLSFDLTYFNSINGPQIFPLGISSSTGFYNRTVNGVTTEKKGWEVSLTGNVIKNPGGFNWDVLVNGSTYVETLKDIYGDEKSIYLAGPDHVFHIGDRLDGYYDYKYLRNSEGKIIYSATGIPLIPPTGTANKQLLGNTNPDFVWAVNNKFGYKNWNFSFQFDGRVGGVIKDNVYAYQLNSGTSLESVGDTPLGRARLQEWKSTNLGTVAATPAYVGDGVVLTGGTIKYDATGNITNMSELTFAPNAKAVTVQSYVQGVYNAFNSGEPYLISKTYVKLREVTIGYTLPKNLFANNKYIRGASISLVGRNLLYFAERTDFDLDQYAAGYSASSRSTLKDPGLQSATTRRYGINFNLTF